MTQKSTPFKQFSEDFKNKKVLIFGLGLLGRGVGSTKVLADVGAEVRVTDKKTESELTPSLEKLKDYNISYALGGHSRADIKWADVIIRNASVPWNHELLEYARKKNKPIKMDAALFFEYAQPHNAIGVTGTRGKTTTSNLIFKIFEAAGKDVVLAGNGVSISSLELLKSYNSETWYVFELSSWQLQAFHQEKISPHLGILTNLYHDHLLDRTFDAYVNDKTAIFQYQSVQDMVFLNGEDEFTQKLVIPEEISHIEFRAEDVPSNWKPVLQGKHNLFNIAAAKAVAEYEGVENQVIKKVVEEFETLPYRLEKIAEVAGVSYINDTTSTTPVALVKALETYPSSHLIAGGTSKQLPVNEMVETINAKAKQVYLLEGSGTDEIIDKINSDLVVGVYDNLKTALDQARQEAQEGEVILFSPGFTSFGMFKNEFDRGDQFNDLVKKLA